VRDSAQIVDLVRRIWTLVKPPRVGPTGERKSTPRPWPVTHRLVLIDGRADEGTRVGANNRANDCPAHVAGCCGAEDRAPVAAPKPAPRPVAVSQEVKENEANSSTETISKLFFFIMWS
jgi:hypothetical protein